MISSSTGFRRSNRSNILSNKTGSTKDYLHTDHHLNHFGSEHGIQMSLKKVTSVNNLGKLQLSVQKDLPSQNKIKSLLDCQANQRKSGEIAQYGNNLTNTLTQLINSRSYQEQARTVYQRYHNNKNIILQKQRVSMSDRFFKNLLDDYHNKIHSLSDQNKKLVDLKDRFESYLASLNLTDVWKNFYGEQAQNLQSPLRDGKNTVAKNNLKMLNLEKKNQTLNFIIKQYRKGNTEDIKNLQKKINQYRPNIQKQLTEKLQTVNRKLKETQDELSYFKRQFNTKCPSFTWDQTILKNRQYIQKYEKIQQQNKQIKNENARIKLQNQQIKSQQIAQQKMLKEIQDLNCQVFNLNFKIEQSQNVLKKNEQKIDHLQRIQEQFNFSQQKYKKTQTDMQRKKQTIKENSIIIAKLQSQNLIINQKLLNFVDKQHKQIFMQEHMRSKLQNMFIQINQLKRRAEQSIFDNHLDIKEKKYFLSHLIQKIYRNYEQIVGQYQEQLVLYEKQSKSWQKSMKKIFSQDQIKRNILKQGTQQLQKIKIIHEKCIESIKDINHNIQCQSCRGWMTHWGQIDNLYLKAIVLLQKLTNKIQ